MHRNFEEADRVPTDDTVLGADVHDDDENTEAADSTDTGDAAANNDTVETVESAEAGDLQEEKPRPSPRPRKWSGRHARGLVSVTVISAVIAILMTAAGGVLWYVRSQHDHGQRDDAITVAAREEVLALLTLDPANVQASLDRVLASATGGWRQQFAQNANQFKKVVHDGQVRTRATIAASAIQKADDNSATVLVSANAVIANTESPKGYPAVYRVLMNLERQGEKWLVSDLQFVA